MICRQCLALALVFVAVAVLGCQKKLPFVKERLDAIPPDAVKQTPDTDSHPPILRSAEWDPPIPMPGPVNTAGGEDSPFITPDGQEFYFFFTPDVRVPANGQLNDSVTGIWQCRLEGGAWTEPERVLLNYDVSLDGAEFVFGDTMWFASVRTGNYSEIDWYIATRSGGDWTNWRNAGSHVNYDLRPGELHISSDHRTMYHHKTGAFGGLDIVKSERTGGLWGEPVNLGNNINSHKDEGWPYLSSDMKTLYFTGWNDSFAGPCIFRSKLGSLGNWSPRELIIEQFAGEPTLDDAGNLYFVHHYYSGGPNNHMVEADIYFCRRR